MIQVDPDCVYKAHLHVDRIYDRLIESNAQLVAQFGDYVLYRMRAER